MFFPFFILFNAIIIVSLFITKAIIKQMQNNIYNITSFCMLYVIITHNISILMIKKFRGFIIAPVCFFPHKYLIIPIKIYAINRLKLAAFIPKRLTVICIKITLTIAPTTVEIKIGVVFLFTAINILNIPENSAINVARTDNGIYCTDSIYCFPPIIGHALYKNIQYNGIDNPTILIKPLR